MDNVSGRQRVRDEDVKGVELPPGACVCVFPPPSVSLFLKFLFRDGKESAACLGTSSREVYAGDKGTH
jgi:hypothetical protein